MLLISPQHDLRLLSSGGWGGREPHLHARCFSHSQGSQGSLLFIQLLLVFQLAQVIVITHSHPPDRVGVRWLVPGLKVYHIPFPTLVSSATLPNFLTFLPYLRTIVLRERITLIHSHASLSALGHEGVLHAHLLGVRTVFTDHSLFGFADAASILTNKLLEGMLRNVDAAICVSYIGYGSSTPASENSKLMLSFSRENTVLRANLPPQSVYVIPNAIVADHFRPARSRPPTETSQSSTRASDQLGSLTPFPYSNRYRYISSRLQKGNRSSRSNRATHMCRIS